MYTSPRSILCHTPVTSSSLPMSRLPRHGDPSYYSHPWRTSSTKTTKATGKKTCMALAFPASGKHDGPEAAGHHSSLMKKMGIYIISVEGSTLTSYFYLPRSGDMPTLLGHLHTGFTCFPPVPSPHTCPGNSVHEIAPGGEDSKTFDT